MDKLEQYRNIVCRLIEEYASYIPSYADVRTEAIVDRQRDHYEVMAVGWDRDRRVHGCIFHIDIHNGKVWIEYNGTDIDIGEEMVAAGIPKQDIVLGFQPAELRTVMGYAAG
jgi:hypothetical protein